MSAWDRVFVPLTLIAIVIIAVASFVCSTEYTPPEGSGWVIDRAEDGERWTLRTVDEQDNVHIVAVRPSEWAALETGDYVDCYAYDCELVK